MRIRRPPRPAIDCARMQAEAALLPIEKVVAQRACDRLERDALPRNFVFAKQLDFETLAARAEVDVPVLVFLIDVAKRPTLRVCRKLTYY